MVNPNRLMLAAICRTCFGECVRALVLLAVSRATGMNSIRRSVVWTRLEPISKSFEEDHEAGELDEAEEVLAVVFPADEDAALPLDPGEEAFDEPTSHVTA